MGLLKKYVIIDLPPALWVSKTYLKKQFPSLKIADFQTDLDKNKLKELIQDNQIIFLTPTQLKFLDKSISLMVIAINCLQEMPRLTIE